MSVGEYARKSGDNMSFVGIHNTNEGLIAFADSKTTIQYNNGFKTEDIKRGRIKKVFKNNKFIFVTYGNNELFSSIHKTNIEDYIESKLIADISYIEFFSSMHEDIKGDVAEYNDGIYNFIIGSIDENNDYYVQKVQIDARSDAPKFSNKDYSKKCHFAGNDKYVEIFQKIPIYNDYPIEKGTKILKQQISKLVELFDLDAKYNPVGTPINTLNF